MSSSTAKTYTLGELAELIDVSLDGDPARRITGLASLAGAGPGQVSFFTNPAYRGQLESSKAAAVIIAAEHAALAPADKLISAKPYLSFALASRLFVPETAGPAAVHPAASVADDAELGRDVSIGPNAVIEAGARIGDRVRVGGGSAVGAGSSIGADSVLYSGVTVYHGVHIGERAVVHGGAVIGADGFGFAFDGEKSVKIHQLGGVRIGDDVEVGPGCTIDRGALDDTVIGNGVKLDSQVHIAHNCQVGDHCLLCGCAGLAGSVTLGEYCIIGGGVGVVDNISIAPRTQVGPMTLVSKAIPETGSYSSGTGLMKTSAWRRNILRFEQLDGMARRLKRLEKATLSNPNESESK